MLLSRKQRACILNSTSSALKVLSDIISPEVVRQLDYFGLEGLLPLVYSIVLPHGYFSHTVQEKLLQWCLGKKGHSKVFKRKAYFCPCSANLLNFATDTSVVDYFAGSTE